MLKRSWIRQLFTHRLTATIRKAPRRRRPAVEVLEDRCVPSTFIVNNTLDTFSGGVPTKGTLRWAIEQADSTPGANTIAFDRSVFSTPQTITLVFASGELEPGPLELSNTTGLETITGPAAGVTVHGDGQDGVFGVDSLVTASISGLTISGGGTGGVLNDGTLTMTNCTVSHNSEVGYLGGSAGLDNGGMLTMTNCTVSDNFAEGVDGASGGGVGNGGTATLIDCTISGNSADGDHGNGDGGGLQNSGTLTLTNCTMSGNFAGSYSSCNGGALFNSGTATLVNTIVAGNTAGTGPDGDAHGGAIFNQGALTVNNSTLTNDVAAGGASATGSSLVGHNGMGGAIYMSAGTLSINSSTLAGNGAAGGGGGYPTGSGSGYGHGPGGNGQGGGLYIAGGTLSINNSTLADNQASPGSVYGGSTGDASGGGIYNVAGPSALQMYDTILAHNSASVAGPDLDGSVTSLGHNLIGDTTGGSGFAASDLVNVNPQLGPLQNNGGPTQTMALLPGSPAIDAGDNTNAPAYDQRGPGFARIVNGTIDIGAFEVQNGSAAQSISLSIAGFPPTIVAGTASNFTVTAHNADGSTDTGYTGTVHFTSSDGQAGLPADYTFTAADAGVHTFTATLETAGTQSITASDASAGVSASEGGIAVSPAAAKTLTVSGFPSPVTAGQAGTFTVTALDSYGNTATGYAGTVHFTSSDAKAVLPANYIFQTNDAGVHSFSATLKTAGTQSITATDTATASITGNEAGITVNPAAASKFILTAPASVKAGVAFSLTLTVEDAYGNVVTGYTGTVHFSSTDTKATLPKNYTFTAADKGVHTFSGLVLRKRGYQKITITDTHDSSLLSSVTVDVL